MKIKILLISFFVFGIVNLISGQETTIYIKQQSSDWQSFSKKIEKEYNLRFYFDTKSFPNVQIVINEDSVLLDKLLKDTFSQYEITVTKDNQGNYFLFKDFKLQSDLDIFFSKYQKNEVGLNDKDGLIQYTEGGKDYLKTYQEYISENVVIGTKGSAIKNGKVSISGYVLNQDDGEPISQAYLKILEKNKFETTNISGYYEIQIEPGDYTLLVNSLGKFEKTYRVNVLSNGQLNISLKTKPFLIDEAVVSASRNHNIKSSNMGFEKMSAVAIKKIPVVLGEQDIIKVALLLPGVQTVGEASAGFNVRGSPADQNMFYINSLPVYNSSHLFGLFTTFNSDAINEFRMYKSNIPIEYGGFLSSVFDIDSKEGNKENFSARGGIGPVSAKLLIEGPITKNKGSYLISARSTYSEWLLNQINNPEINNSSASFYDGLINLTYSVNEKNNLKLFLYGSNDNSDIAFGLRNKYDNLGGTLNWTHFFSKSFISEIDIIKSQYAYTEENYEIDYLGNKHSFELNHNEAKLGFKYFPTYNHSIVFGVNVLYYELNYGDFVPLNSESLIKTLEFEPEKALNSSVYLGDQWDITNKLTVEGGVRFSMYNYLGPKTVYEYAANQPREIDNIIDTISYSNNETISNYNNFDYKLSAKYELSESFSVKASYNRLHQYIYMLSNSISVTPTNKWKLSDSHLKPMRGEQYTFGLYKNFGKDQIETSAEVYYKTVGNLVEYKDGADFITNQIPETNIIQGDLRAYGIELLVKKKSGQLNGWINYTYSRALVQVNNTVTGEMNNLGLEYPANYDRPHALNVSLNYKVTKRLSISANVVYSTGRPITYPTSIYYQNDIQITEFSMRNEYRISDYFRTDLSINIEGNLKKHKLAHGSWSISFYNLTGRRNPYTIQFRNENGQIKGYEISILGTVIPSISYNIKIGNYDN
ncbi:MAG: TonB-dependent receptor [Bacteroidales bacterium]|nr:TonB-dependent receptor [Bacteroidales bacterium]